MALVGSDVKMRARRLYPRSKGFRGAYERGALAALHGKQVTACPYKKGSGTWRQTWRLAWLRGFHSVDASGSES